MGILWIVVVGFIAGLIARFLAPGPNKPVGFLLTTVLGIAAAFVATFIGQAVGWYRVRSRRRRDRRYSWGVRSAVCLEPPCRQPDNPRSGKSTHPPGPWPERVVTGR